MHNDCQKIVKEKYMSRNLFLKFIISPLDYDPSGVYNWSVVNLPWMNKRLDTYMCISNIECKKRHHQTERKKITCCIFYLIKCLCNRHNFKKGQHKIKRIRSTCTIKNVTYITSDSYYEILSNSRHWWSTFVIIMIPNNSNGS